MTSLHYQKSECFLSSQTSWMWFSETISYMAARLKLNLHLASSNFTWATVNNSIKSPWGVHFAAHKLKRRQQYTQSYILEKPVEILPLPKMISARAFPSYMVRIFVGLNPGKQINSMLALLSMADFTNRSWQFCHRILKLPQNFQVRLLGSTSLAEMAFKIKPIVFSW